MTINYPVKRATLAQMYCISRPTLRKWLQAVDVEHNGTLSPADLRKLIDAYGLPKGVEIKGV
jgi:hypothetical protein